MTRSAPVIDTSDIPQPLTVESGQPLAITVKVTGKPTPTVRWQIGKKRIKESSKFELRNKNDAYTLTIKKSNNDLNEGVWVVASNDVGDDCCQIEVKVNSKAVSMSDVRQNNVEDDSHVQDKTLQGMKKKIKKTMSTTSLQDTSEINKTAKRKISNDVVADKKKDTILVDEIEDEPYKRRSKKNSTTKRNSKVTQDESKENISTNIENNTPKSTDTNIDKKSDSKPPRSKSPRKSEDRDRSDVMETDFDSIEDMETRTDIIEIVKVNEKNDKNTNSDVKIVIVNNDEDEDDVEEEEGDDDLENNKLNGNGVETEILDEKLWFLNDKNIIDLCREALLNYDLEDKIDVDDFAEKKNIRKETEIIDDIKPKIPETDNYMSNNTTNEPNKCQNATSKVKNDDKIEIPDTSKQSEKSKAVENSIPDKIATAKNELRQDKNKIKPDMDNKSLESSQKKPENQNTFNKHPSPSTKEPLKPVLKPSKENHFDKDVDDHEGYSRYRPPSRSSLKLSQTDNIPIPMMPPTHSILGKPPPPPGVVENKPLTLTAYVTHKKSHNTPRRQKRLDKARSRSADPLGRDDEANHEENEFIDSRDASTDSINWERYSCTLPGKWSSSSVLGKPGLVPTRSEEYLIIRKSDGKVKSLNNSRDNFFRSFQSLDRLNDSEAGSTSSKIGLRTLNTQYQIVTVTTTEETFVVPKEEDKIDGKKQVNKIEDPKPIKGVSKTIQTESELEQRLLQKLKPSVSEKGVGSTNINFKDTGVGPEKTFSAKSDKVSQSDIRIGSDKSQQTKPSSTVVGQQTDFVKVQIPTKLFDESTQTSLKDQNKDVVTIAYHEIIPVVNFTPVTPEEEVPKEPDLFVSQVNSFDFCEVTRFYLDETSAAHPDRQIQKHNSKIPKASQPSKNETSQPRKNFKDKFNDLNNEDGKHKNINITNDPRDIIGNSPIPPISPHHYDVHGDVTPSNRLDSFIFTPGNHTYVKQNRDHIPGQRYVLSYTDGTTPPRDLNRSDSKDDQEKPSRIPRSLKSLKNKDTPEKKRDTSCERVVEISEKRRASLTPDNQIDPQNPLKQQQETDASKTDSSFSGESSGIASPERAENRRSRIATSYHGPPAIKPNKSNNRFDPRWY